MRKKQRCFGKEGISLVTLIIEIIVIIIIATISLMLINTEGQAETARFVQEFEELRKCVETQRLSDLKKGQYAVDDSFSKVYIDGDIPSELKYTELDGKKEVRLVSLDTIGCDEMKTGRAYNSFEPDGDEIKTVTFGEDDVYIYDATGKLFFVKGIDYKGNKTYVNPTEN